jgi:hypothetical protein
MLLSSCNVEYCTAAAHLFERLNTSFQQPNPLLQNHHSSVPLFSAALLTAFTALLLHRTPTPNVTLALLRPERHCRCVLIGLSYPSVLQHRGSAVLQRCIALVRGQSCSEQRCFALDLGRRYSELLAPSHIVTSPPSHIAAVSHRRRLTSPPSRIAAVSHRHRLTSPPSRISALPPSRITASLHRHRPISPRSRIVTVSHPAGPLSCTVLYRPILPAASWLPL